MKRSDYPPARPSIEETRNRELFQPYVNTLTKIFGEILDWPEPQTLAWVEQRLQQETFRTWFGHKPPCHDAAAVIVMATIGERLMARHLSLVDARNDIMLALVKRGKKYYQHPDTVPAYDWKRVREEIAVIIKKYEKKAA